MAQGEESVWEQTWWGKDILRRGNLLEQEYERVNWLFVLADFGLVHQLALDHLLMRTMMRIQKKRKKKTRQPCGTDFGMRFCI